ncbi:hypothetical protein JTE90_001773 [Oedothorax gibbosus]|uniref:Peptidase S1 domain-containing protein n=1 Tax=Oedothorax gibbosus TaxID=931172 RepID=A0AAV6VRU9_9ARAC|nr:hypothetical protein JTE90_001773 [Oedothorax gibbosus]
MIKSLNLQNLSNLLSVLNDSWNSGLVPDIWKLSSGKKFEEDEDDDDIERASDVFSTISSCPRGFVFNSKSRCLATLGNIRGKPRNCGRSNRFQICCPQGTETNEVPDLRLVNPIRRVVRTRFRTSVTPSITPSVNSMRLSTNAPDTRDTERGKVNPYRTDFMLGRKDAKQGAWPWMDAISLNPHDRATSELLVTIDSVKVLITKINPFGAQSPHCTSFLIDRQHVLSAAHCFKDKDRTQYSTRIGHVDINRADEYPILRLAVHPGYVNGSNYDDIAMFDVPNFSPICLPWSKEFINITGKGTTIAGWGNTVVGGPMSTVLQELYGIPVLSNYACSQAFLRKARSFSTSFPTGITPGFICAGFTEYWGKDTCQGDSGGPLMYYHKGQWFVVGVVSFGSSCGQPELPGN